MRVVITHSNADFDALATLIAVTRLWPDVQACLAGPISPSVKRYLALHKDSLELVTLEALEGETIEELIVVDTRARNRLKPYATLLEKAQRVVVFDHHAPSSDDVVADEDVIEPVGACVTLICERLEEAGVSLSVGDATLMMLGLYADTGRLSFGNTSTRDILAAAYLRKQGARLEVVNRYLQQEFTADQQRLLVEVMGSAREVKREGLRLALASHVGEAYVKGAAVVVERVLQLTGVDALVLVAQQMGSKTVQVIARSNTRHLDVAALMGEFGGGGHPAAAAAKIKPGEASEVASVIFEMLQSWPVDPLDVADVMSSPVQTVAHDTTLNEFRRCLERWGVHGMPVMRDGEVVGVVSGRDVEQAARRGDWDIPVAGFMSQRVISASPEEPLSEALKRMTEHDIGRLPVLDEGVLVGIISRSDALRRLYSEDAE